MRNWKVWRAAKAYYLVLILAFGFILVYLPVWKRLIGSWYNSEDYSHGFLIVPLCAYIVWQKKEVLANTPEKGSTWGLLWVVLSLMIYVISYYGEIETLASLAMVLLLGGAVFYVLGFTMLKKLLFPLFLLLFMIPVPAQIYSSLTIPLQLFVSKLSAFLVSVLGVPVHREGNVISLPEHTLQVVQACSGLRSMISFLTLSAVFSYFTLRSNILRAVLFIAGVPAAVGMNIFRIVAMALAFHLFDYDLTRGVVHTIFGGVVFVLGVITIAIFRGVLAFWERPATGK